MKQSVRIPSDWIATILFAPYFFVLLLFFHPFHMLSRLLGTEAKERVLLIMNQSFLWGLQVWAGLRVNLRGAENIKKLESYAGRSVVFVSNHQSMYDITLILTLTNRGKIRFVAKRELGRWIPSISIALKNMEAALIDRGSRAQAIRSIRSLGSRAAQLGRDVCIYPEGTRSRTGELLPFKSLGLLTLLKEMPGCVVMPISISGSGEILKHGFWPVTYGVSVTFTALEPLDSAVFTPHEVVNLAFDRIHEAYLSSSKTIPV
jgi:1-acyl-sn-glycerol-3-phosphate acyltransferase